MQNVQQPQKRKLSDEIIAEDEDYQRDPEHPRNLIPEICRLLYSQEAMTGSGGAISMRRNDKIYVAPSGVQKERLQPEDMFVINDDGDTLKLPLNGKICRMSQCTPLFLTIYRLRGSECVIHSHSKRAVLATIISSGNEFRISDLQMIKGIYKRTENRNYRFGEEVVIPIIENTPTDPELQENLVKAMENYPDTCCVLIRRHGLYIWGTTWQQAKLMYECYEYLFDIAIQLKQLGMN
ncbi:putative methylthioribulose-1-phosphate dehydratase [Trichoplax sp. H2]|nr:putative methylthioribulose-1-phosphate dehydratase [Trichoplax sp. H2]|eukprot:RDD45104.1 putative methylthioribulose-1-phosphate dehydratase [Trichoplax sp. H2]